MLRSRIRHLCFILRLLVIASVAVFLSGCTCSSEKIEQHLSELPSDLELQEKIPQMYLIEVNYYNRDIYGNLLSKMRLTADYTRALPEGKVRWNNVRIAKAPTPADPFPEGELQNYMENMTYLPSGDVLNESFFRDFPNDVMETKVLIWDMLSIEVWAWNYFNDLNLNEAFWPDPEAGDLNMAGAGTMNSKDLNLTWVGISEMNNEFCALIQYESFINPVSMHAGNFKMVGRTNYWGNIWVSLEDKQIEFANLHEDGLFEMTFNIGEEPALFNAFREIEFKKVITD